MDIDIDLIQFLANARLWSYQDFLTALGEVTYAEFAFEDGDEVGTWEHINKYRDFKAAAQALEGFSIDQLEKLSKPIGMPTKP